MNATSLIAREEGFSAEPYICTEVYPTVSMKAYALTNGSETSLFLDESDALAALKLKEILGKKSWRVVELVEVVKNDTDNK